MEEEKGRNKREKIFDKILIIIYFIIMIELLPRQRCSTWYISLTFVIILWIVILKNIKFLVKSFIKICKEQKNKYREVSRKIIILEKINQAFIIGIFILFVIYCIYINYNDYTLNSDELEIIKYMEDLSPSYDLPYVPDFSFKNEFNRYRNDNTSYPSVIIVRKQWKNI